MRRKKPKTDRDWGILGASAGLSTTLQRGGSLFARWDAHQATQTLPGRPSIQASLLGTTPTNIPEQKREV